MSGVLLIQADGGVVHLTLNRPDKRNALSHELLTQFERAWRRLR